MLMRYCFSKYLRCWGSHYRYLGKGQRASIKSLRQECALSVWETASKVSVASGARVTWGRRETSDCNGARYYRIEPRRPYDWLLLGWESLQVLNMDEYYEWYDWTVSRKREWWAVLHHVNGSSKMSNNLPLNLATGGHSWPWQEHFWWSRVWVKMIGCKREREEESIRG